VYGSHDGQHERQTGVREVGVKVEESREAAAIRLRAPDAPNLWDDIRLQKLWLAMERKQWRSLAVLGASASINSHPIAELLAQLAWRYRGQPSSVSDLRDLSMRLIDYEVREMRSQIDMGSRLIVSLRSIFENPTATPVAKETDAVILLVAVGITTFKQAEETIAAIGRERVLGSILLGGKKPKRRARGDRPG
jgi:hypothetical protein